MLPLDSSVTAQPFSLYAHFPYCSHRCPYCDFNVHVRKQIPEQEFIAALLMEARYRSSQPEWKERKLATIFLGGGTPSLFSAETISDLLTKIREIWQFEDQIEISLEANPDTISESKLFALRTAGVNRLSIGVQSFSDKFLKVLGRNHSAAQARDSIEAAQAAGFENINIDLMFSLPQQNLNELREDITAVLSLATQHISFYNLTIEAGTPFYERHKAGSLRVPSDDLAAKFMGEIISALTSNEFNHYEISNYARADFACKHNQAYWQSKDYLGLGPGAHSAVGNYMKGIKTVTNRWANQSMPERYLEKPANCVAWSEAISGTSLVFEEILLGLRQSVGIEIGSLSNRLDPTKYESFLSLVKELNTDGFLFFSEERDNIALTERGLLIADSVIEKFAERLS